MILCLPYFYRENLNGENLYLKRQLKEQDDLRMSMPVKSGPFDMTNEQANNQSNESDQIALIRKKFEDEKAKIEEQRSMAEENAIKVIFLFNIFLGEIGIFSTYLKNKWFGRWYGKYERSTSLFWRIN